MAHGSHRHMHHVGAHRIHRTYIHQYHTTGHSHSTQHSSSTTLPPEQIFGYVNIQLMSMYQIFQRFLSQEYEDVKYLRQNGIIPSDVPIFNSEAALKLFYYQNLSSYKAMSGVFGCWMAVGLLLLLIGIILIAVIGEIGFIGMIVFGIIAFLMGLLMFCLTTKNIRSNLKKYLKEYMCCKKMPQEVKQQLEAQAAADAEQYYQQLAQYNARNPSCQYVAQIILTIDSIKQGQKVLAQQQRNEVEPTEQVAYIQPPQIQQQTVSNEAINQINYNQNIPMPNQNIDSIQSPPVL